MRIKINHDCNHRNTSMELVWIEAIFQEPALTIDLAKPVLAHERPTEVASGVPMLDVAEMDPIPSDGPVYRNTSFDPQVLVDVFVDPRRKRHWRCLSLQRRVENILSFSPKGL